MKIFIVDDDQLSLFLAKTKLTMIDASHDIQTFASSQEALAYIKEAGAPDLILLDLNMPIMDGWTFLESLSLLQDTLQSKCQIYILSSSISDAELAKGKEHKLVAGFLHKPIKSEDVRNLLAP